MAKEKGKGFLLDQERKNGEAGRDRKKCGREREKVSGRERVDVYTIN